jgi:hypothetical protein
MANSEVTNINVVEMTITLMTDETLLEEGIVGDLS